MSDDNERLLCWIPSHTRISENEQVNKVARSALSKVSEKSFKILYTDLKIKETNTYKNKGSIAGAIINITNS